MGQHDARTHRPKQVAAVCGFRQLRTRRLLASQLSHSACPPRSRSKILLELHFVEQSVAIEMDTSRNQIGLARRLIEAVGGPDDEQSRVRMLEGFTTRLSRLGHKIQFAEQSLQLPIGDARFHRRFLFRLVASTCGSKSTLSRFRQRESSVAEIQNQFLVTQEIQSE